MKKQILTLMVLAIILLSSVSQIQAEVKNKQILGEWLYEVTEAPYGYEKGSLIFSETDGQITCIIKLEAGELAVSNLKIEKENISFSTMVDGNEINVELKLEENKLTGKVVTPEGPKVLTALKKEI
ncbi:MAG: hypothetical protein Q8S54_19330 [Bacteroidota bacterium]|nr:hypothetical protein [Odoribacter sp.]MDP3645324.1 hypothetical protein [Bacteroidota bacterium]